MCTLTMELVSFLFVVSVLFVVGNNGQSLELFECKPGVEYIENECNQCYCLNNGELVCQINKCTHNKYKNLENCKTGTVWWINCNKCWCMNTGTICTNIRCF